MPLELRCYGMLIHDERRSHSYASVTQGSWLSSSPLPHNGLDGCNEVKDAFTLH